MAEWFAWPAAWPLLLAPLGVAALFAAAERRRRLQLGALVAGERVGVLCAEVAPGARRLRRLAAVAAAGLAALAALQPLGAGPRAVEQRGIDVLIALDVSRSMLARDVAPCRLDRARAEIAELAARARGERLGLLVFAGEARLLVPLTLDGQALTELLPEADPLAVERGGTDLGAALERALSALPSGAGEAAAVLLLTDGEDHGGRGLLAAERAAELGVTVHCVGFGSPRGSKIPLAGEAGERFLADGSGAEVISAMDPAALRRIAEATGGEFVDGAEPGVLVELYEDELRSMARKAFDRSSVDERVNRFQWPLLAALLFLLLELAWSERRGAS